MSPGHESTRELGLTSGVEGIGPKADDRDTVDRPRARDGLLAAQGDHRNRRVALPRELQCHLGPQLARVSPEGNYGISPTRLIGRWPHEESGSGHKE
jgi:hypothetical protein